MAWPGRSCPRPAGRRGPAVGVVRGDVRTAQEPPRAPRGGRDRVGARRGLRTDPRRPDDGAMGAKGRGGVGGVAGARPAGTLAAARRRRDVAAGLRGVCVHGVSVPGGRLRPCRLSRASGTDGRACAAVNGAIGEAAEGGGCLAVDQTSPAALAGSVGNPPGGSIALRAAVRRGGAADVRDVGGTGATTPADSDRESPEYLIGVP